MLLLTDRRATEVAERCPGSAPMVFAKEPRYPLANGDLHG